MEEKIMNEEAMENTAEVAVKAAEVVGKSCSKTVIGWAIGTTVVAVAGVAAYFGVKKYANKKRAAKAGEDNMAIVKKDFEENPDEKVEK